MNFKNNFDWWNTIHSETNSNSDKYDFHKIIFSNFKKLIFMNLEKKKTFSSIKNYY